MGILDIVDEEDRIIGQRDFEEIHSKGLRHRSVQVLVFRDETLDTLLVSQRSRNERFGRLKLHCSAADHVEPGQSYQEAGLAELREELFSESVKLPANVFLIKVANYKNDSRSTNSENTCLFYAIYPGTFEPEPKEIEKTEWRSRHDVWKDMLTNPDLYSQTFINAMHQFKLWIGKNEPI